MRPRDVGFGERKNKIMSDTPVTDFEKKTLEEFVKEYKGTLVDNKEPWYLVHEATAKKLERERDTALEQLESVKRRMKTERTAAREAIDAAEAERDKAYKQFYENPDAAKHEREKAEKQNAKWKEKWTWASNEFAKFIKKIEELEKELNALKSK